MLNGPFAVTFMAILLCLGVLMAIVLATRMLIAILVEGLQWVIATVADWWAP